MQWQNLIPLIDNALSGQDDYGERNFDDCGRSQTIHLPLAWGEQFIELSKDKNPFNNPD
jgi:hypothetical protein